MATKEMWYGKRPRTGIESFILEQMQRFPEHKYIPGQMAKILDRNPGSVTAAMSVLRRQGWLDKDTEGFYSIHNPPPREDRDRVIPIAYKYRASRSKPSSFPWLSPPNSSSPNSGKAHDEKVGDECIIKCILILGGKPIWQDEDTGRFFTTADIKISLG